MADSAYIQHSTNAVTSNPSLKDGACLMAVQVTGSCGEATLSKAAMLLEGQTIDSELVRGTTLQWFPKEHLRFVNKTLQRINRLFSSKGVAFGRGLTMIPLSIADDVQASIDQAKAEFDNEIDTLMNSFDECVERHKEANPDITGLIERYKMDADQFRGRFIFKSIPPMAVQPLFENDEDELRGNITETLFEEIASDAAKLAKGSFIGKEQCSQKAVSAIRKLKTKLVNLAFLDEGIFKIVESFDEALNGLPLTGPVTDGQFHRLANYLQSVSNEETIRGIASGDIDDTDELEAAPGLSESWTEEVMEPAASTLIDHVTQEHPDEVQMVDSPDDVETLVHDESASSQTHATNQVSVFDDEFGFGGF